MRGGDALGPDARDGFFVPVALLGALLLFVSLFLDWFELTSPDLASVVTLSGWEALETADAALVLIAAAAAYLAAAGGGGGRALLAPGVAAFVLVLTLLLTGLPSFEIIDQGGPGSTTSAGLGLLVALAGSALLLLAGGLAARGERPERATSPYSR